MSSSETAAGVNTPRSVKSSVMRLAGVKSMLGSSKDTLPAEAAGGARDSFWGSAESMSFSAAAPKTAPTCRLLRVPAGMASRCDSGYRRANL